jgi:hypothetical protein
MSFAPNSSDGSWRSRMEPVGHFQLGILQAARSRKAGLNSNNSCENQNKTSEIPNLNALTTISNTSTYLAP